MKPIMNNLNLRDVERLVTPGAIYVNEEGPTRKGGRGWRGIDEPVMGEYTVGGRTTRKGKKRDSVHGAGMTQTGEIE